MADIVLNDLADDHEPWSREAALERLRRLAPSLPVRIPPEPEFLESFSNDASRMGDVVLRVCWRGDRSRLIREAALAAALPAAIGFPEVLGAGESDELSWMLCRKVHGQGLGAVWFDMPDTRLRTVMADYARVLNVLHAWSPTEPIAAMLAEHGALQPTSVEIRSIACAA